MVLYVQYCSRGAFDGAVSGDMGFLRKVEPVMVNSAQEMHQMDCIPTSLSSY